MIRRNLAIFISGRGSNMESLIRFADSPDAAFRVALVLADKEAEGLKTAQKYGIPTAIRPRRRGESQEQFENAIVSILKSARVELLALAGYMRLVGRTLLAAYEGRILNIHPSLLPSFKGLDAQGQAFQYGVKYSGCTVHVVDQGMDTGPILAQRVVSLRGCASRDEVAARILKEEHGLYPKVIEAFCRGEFRFEGRKTNSGFAFEISPASEFFQRLHFGQADISQIPLHSGAAPVGVSACLLGVPCRYDGKSKEVRALVELLAHRDVIPVCPEVLSRLWVPRDPMEFKEGDGETVLKGSGRLVDSQGVDRTAALLEGSERAFALLQSFNVDTVVLKARSPSCGLYQIHRNGALTEGRGVFAARVKAAKITSFSDEQIAQLRAHIGKD